MRRAQRTKRALSGQSYFTVDRIVDERLLRAIYSFLNERENSEKGRMWNSLTEEQKKEVLQTYAMSLRTIH
jgi:hypothetical protein